MQQQSCFMIGFGGIYWLFLAQLQNKNNVKLLLWSSLRSKRFGKAFRTFDALFAFLAARKLGRAQKSASITVALAPIFALPKSENRLQPAESPTETLATQANCDPLSPRSDKHLNTPYAITGWSNIQVMRIKEMITRHEMCWCVTKFSQLVT